MTAHTSLSFLFGILVPSFVPPRHVQKYMERFPPQTSGSPFFRGNGPIFKPLECRHHMFETKEIEAFPKQFHGQSLGKKMWATTPWDIPPPRTLKSYYVQLCTTMYMHVCNECAMHQTTFIYIYICIYIYVYLSIH